MDHRRGGRSARRLPEQQALCASQRPVYREEGRLRKTASSTKRAVPTTKNASTAKGTSSTTGSNYHLPFFPVHRSGASSGRRLTLARGCALNRGLIARRPAAGELCRAQHRVGARRVYGIFNLPPLGLDEVLGEDPRPHDIFAGTPRSHQSVALPSLPPSRRSQCIEEISPRSRSLSPRPSLLANARL